PVIRKALPRVRIAHWCFDLHPECSIAEGVIRPDSYLSQALRRVLKTAYASCDLVADLGSCMRERLAVYGHASRKATLVPWALVEPDVVPAVDPVTRKELFGESALGVLYSGNFGRAHSYDDFLQLARRLRNDSIHFCFGTRGNQARGLEAAVRP